MMQQVYIEDLSKYVGQEVTLRGWLYNKRSSGKIQFLLMRDGTGVCQCVAMKNKVDDATFAVFDQLTQESAFAAIGTIQATDKAPGGYELFVSSLELISVAQEYPISPKEHGVEYLMSNRHLWLRSSKQHAIQRIRHTIVHAIRDFFDERGFNLMDAPILTPAACEGTSTLFETEYFDEGKAYLTQSGQLYGEAGAMALGKVYVFGPTFRAEKSKTRRHLTEFWMVEPEVAFMDLAGDMELAEQFISHIVARVLEDRKVELQTLERDISKLETVKAPFPRLHYDEAAQILKEFWGGLSKEEKETRFASGHKEFTYGDDFGAPDETIISSRYDRPVIVHHYPAAVKAFYMKRDPNEPDKALAMDVLAPEGYGEIIGGSQREDDYDTLLGRIKEHELDVASLEWYLDLRRYGSVPHAGFGLGVERTVAWICGIEHIRETIPFPRTLNRIWP
jgi:asparaginyl-tRNA synthetase